MNEILAYLLIGAIFIILPLWGLFQFLRDIIISYNRNKEINAFVKEFKTLLEVLRSENLASFDAGLSNWMERTIPKLRVEWLQTGARLILQTKIIAFGEEHRQALSNDKEFRFSAIRLMRNIESNIEDTDTIAMYDNLGKLLSLLYTSNTTHENRISSQKEIVRVLLNCAELLPNEVYKAQPLIEKTFRKISLWGKPSENGMPLLLLHWMMLMLGDENKYQEKQKFRFFNRRKKPLKAQLILIAEKYESNDLPGVMEVMNGSFL